MIRIFICPKATDKHTFSQEIAALLWNSSIERATSGKPFLGSLNPRISISHTSIYWCVMASDTECGVDIELRSRKSSHLSRRFTTQEELSLCERVFAENPSLLVWCAKEALFKYFSRTEVDFKKDLQITHATPTSLEAEAFNQKVRLKWYTQGELLIVHSL
ncbi:MAG: 4'-phosphopantetheinyl transferase superfamily protein [Rikenellaceae bacterium]